MPLTVIYSKLHTVIVNIVLTIQLENNPLVDDFINSFDLYACLSREIMGWLHVLSEK